MNNCLVILLLFGFFCGLCHANVMSLNECIDYALEHSPKIKRKEIEKNLQQLNTIIEKARFDFNFSAGLSRDVASGLDGSSFSVQKEIIGGIEISTSLDVTDQASTGDRFGSYSVALSKIILGGGTELESRNRIDDSIIQEMVILNQLNKEKRRIIFQVKQAYYRIIRDSQTLKIQQLKLARAEKNLEHAIDREKPLDIAIAHIEVPEEKAVELRAIQNIESSLDLMKELIGLDMNMPFDTAKEFEYHVEDVNLPGAMAFAYDNDEDILNNALTAKSAQLDIDIFRSLRGPEVRLFAEHRQDSATGTDFQGDDMQILGLSVSWPLGDRVDRARLRQTRSLIHDLRWQLFQLRQDKAKEVRELVRRLGELKESVLLQENFVKASDHLVQLYQDRYDHGEIDILELIRSQDGLENSKVQLVILKTSYMEMLAELSFAIGK